MAQVRVGTKAGTEGRRGIDLDLPEPRVAMSRSWIPPKPPLVINTTWSPGRARSATRITISAISPKTWRRVSRTTVSAAMSQVRSGGEYREIRSASRKAPVGSS